MTDEWASLSKSQRIPGAESKVTLNNLWPGTSYHMRLFAENSIGRSEASQVLHAVTEIEAPSEAPSEVNVEAVGSKAIRVMWKPGYSFRSGRNAHLIKGYYVGFKAAHSSSVFSYKTVDSNANVNPGPSAHSEESLSSNTGIRNQYETVITNLERLTKYVIVVKAFNRKGSGPASEEVYVKTNDMGMRVPSSFTPQEMVLQTQDLINHPVFLSPSFMPNPWNWGPFCLPFPKWASRIC